MSKLTKIAVDAMGGEGAPKKTIDGIILNHQSNKKIFYKIFGDKNQISKLINDKVHKSNFEIIHTEDVIRSTDTPLEVQEVIWPINTIKFSFIYEEVIVPSTFTIQTVTP